eukprot:jgi/Mesvir1/9664/Mv12149-RA.1
MRDFPLQGSGLYGGTGTGQGSGSSNPFLEDDLAENPFVPEIYGGPRPGRPVTNPLYDVSLDHPSSSRSSVPGIMAPASSAIPASVRAAMAGAPAGEKKAQQGKAVDKEASQASAQPGVASYFDGKLDASSDMSQVAKFAAQKAAELDKREKEIARREQAVRMAELDLKPKNWPRFRPILYHDINAEIPPPGQSLVRMAYRLWMATCLGYVFNFALISWIFFAGDGEVVDWVLAGVIMAAGVTVSWRGWYRGLYRAMQKDKVMLYVRFFAHFALHTAFAIWMFLAVPSVGEQCAGIFTMLDQLTGNSRLRGFFCLAFVVYWGLVLLLTLHVGQMAIRKFRSGGGVEEVKREKRQKQQQLAVANAVLTATSRV